MTVEMWMGLGIVVAIIGFIMWRVGLNMQAKRNRNAGMGNHEQVGSGNQGSESLLRARFLHQ